MSHSFDKEQLTKEMEQKARHFYQSDEALGELISSTMTSFAHRYLESSSTGELKSKLLGDNHYEVAAKETSLVEALKVILKRVGSLSYPFPTKVTFKLRHLL